MEQTKKFTLIAKTKKNQSLLNKCLKALEKYDNANDKRYAAADDGNDKAYKKFDDMCGKYFDAHCFYFDLLPVYEQVRVKKLW
jgi:hypothetical protein